MVPNLTSSKISSPGCHFLYRISIVSPRRTLRVTIIGLSLRLLERFSFDFKLRRSLRKAFLQTFGESTLKRNDLIFFDIGANRGQTIKSLKAMFPKCSIYSFEPDPIIFAKLLRLNHLQGVRCFNLALGTKSGRFPFWISPLDETSTIHLPDLQSDWNKKKAAILGLNPSEMYKQIEVEVQTVDQIVAKENIAFIDLLKIDVEGGEFEVLQGAANSFKNGIISIVQIEIHNDDLRPSRINEIQDFLFRFRFSRHSVIKHSFGNFQDELWVKGTNFKD